MLASNDDTSVKFMNGDECVADTSEYITCEAKNEDAESPTEGEQEGPDESSTGHDVGTTSTADRLMIGNEHTYPH